MKRVDGAFEPVSWTQATSEIGEALRKIRRESGSEALGIYIGEQTQTSARSLVRALAFGVGSGTPHIFSEANLSFGPQLWATEQMLGHAASLMSDLSRAHYIVLLSGEQRDLGWGPYSPGDGHEGWIQHSRKTKNTKVVVADPRRTELADAMDKYVPIRPGSESYLMLGMLTAIVQRGWTDEQFIRDYTSDFELLTQLIADWEIEHFAAQCGIDAAELSGIALSFSRSAMALVHPARQSFQNEAGILGAWAWLALHAVTANILRPGGLFENKGVLDLFPILTQLRSDKAPRTRSSQYPLLLMQAPATSLHKEALSGPLQALISVSGNPIGRLPNPEKTREALARLDLHVYIGHRKDETAQNADWLLPAVPPWETAALTLDAASSESNAAVRWDKPDVVPSVDARPAEKILSDIYAALRPGMRGSVWGRHLGLFAQYVARADLQQWEEKFLSERLNGADDKWDMIVHNTGPSADGGAESEHHECYLHIGDGDRSLWRPSTQDKKVELLHPEVVKLIKKLVPTAPTERVLRTGQWYPSVTGDADSPESHTLEARVHSDMGFSDGTVVRLSTLHGQCTATIRTDDTLRDDVVDIPFYPGADSLQLLDTSDEDGMFAPMIMDGLSVDIQTEKSP